MKGVLLLVVLFLQICMTNVSAQPTKKPPKPKSTQGAPKSKGMSEEGKMGKIEGGPSGVAVSVSTVQFSPDGKTILTLASDNAVRICGISVGTIGRQKKFKVPGASILSAQFSPDGKNIITISDDSTVRIWDALAATMTVELRGHKDQIQMASYSSDGKKIITASSDSTAIIWDAVTGKLLVQLKDNGDGIKSAQFSPDNDGMVVTLTFNGSAIVWNAIEGKKMFKVNGLSSIGLSPID